MSNCPFDEVKFAVQLDRLEGEHESSLLNQLDNVSEEDLKKAVERLVERRHNLHIQPEFTPLVVGVSRQILAFGAAGLGLLVAFSERLSGLNPFFAGVVMYLGLLYLDLTAISLLVLSTFFLQSRCRYPFLFLRRLGNAFPFFYYETISRSNWWFWSPVKTSKAIFEANKQYLADFDLFVSRTLQEDLKKQARNELQQCFLLISYQGYLDQFEMQLTHLFLYSSIASVISVLSLYVASRWGIV